MGRVPVYSPFPPAQSSTEPTIRRSWPVMAILPLSLLEMTLSPAEAGAAKGAVRAKTTPATKYSAETETSEEIPYRIVPSSRYRTSRGWDSGRSDGSYAVSDTLAPASPSMQAHTESTNTTLAVRAQPYSCPIPRKYYAISAATPNPRELKEKGHNGAPDTVPGATARFISEPHCLHISNTLESFKPGFPRWLPPVADDGSTKGVPARIRP